MPSLFAEALSVGVVLALCLAIVVQFITPLRSARDAAIVGLLLGAAVHLGFEASGANGWYCSHGNACSLRRG
jgi:RsiW-degrading membrane proteinase PrsW (M82 family)